MWPYNTELFHPYNYDLFNPSYITPFIQNYNKPQQEDVIMKDYFKPKRVSNIKSKRELANIENIPYKKITDIHSRKLPPSQEYENIQRIYKKPNPTKTYVHEGSQEKRINEENILRHKTKKFYGKYPEITTNISTPQRKLIRSKSLHINRPLSIELETGGEKRRFVNESGIWGGGKKRNKNIYEYPTMPNRKIHKPTSNDKAIAKAIQDLEEGPPGLGLFPSKEDVENVLADRFAHEENRIRKVEGKKPLDINVLKSIYKKKPDKPYIPKIKRKIKQNEQYIPKLKRKIGPNRKIGSYKKEKKIFKPYMEGKKYWISPYSYLSPDSKGDFTILKRVGG